MSRPIIKRGPRVSFTIEKRCLVWCGRTAAEGCECSAGLREIDVLGINHVINAQERLRQNDPDPTK